MHKGLYGINKYLNLNNISLQSERYKSAYQKLKQIIITQKEMLFGIGWFILSTLFCNLSDALLKIVHLEQNIFQIIFIRLAVGSSLLFLIMIPKGMSTFRTHYIIPHIIRAIVLILSTACWIKGLSRVELTVASVINFTLPFITIPIASLYLKEKINRDRIMVTLLGFISTLVALNPNPSEFNYHGLWLILGIVLYAILDIINKKYAMLESNTNMIFYSSLMSTILCAPLSFYRWNPLSLMQISCLIILGILSNASLFCLINAYKKLDVSFLAPFHFLDFPQTIFLGKLFFNEALSLSTLISFVINIVLSSYLIFKELYLRRPLNKSEKRRQQ